MYRVQKKNEGSFFCEQEWRRGGVGGWGWGGGVRGGGGTRGDLERD